MIPWHNPARFRRACPLLVQTADGWRCAVAAEEVRPFWGRAAAYSGALLLTVYLAATLALFATLRSAGYDVAFRSLVWPQRWGEVRGSQERLYARQAQQAMTAGRFQEAVLALEMVCQLNPRNYEAGLSLASLSLVAGRPDYAERVYERLMRDVPAQRVATAQLWVRPLLASADFEKIKPLAAAMLTENPGDRSAWLHALLFASRATGDTAALTRVLEQGGSLPAWCRDVIETERLLLQNRLADAFPSLTRVFLAGDEPYVPYFQTDRLLRHGRPEAALALLNAYGNRIPIIEAVFLRLRIFQITGNHALHEGEVDTALQLPLTPHLVAQFAASLVRQPDPALFDRFLQKLSDTGPALSAETLPLYHATYLAAVLSGNQAGADVTLSRINRLTGSDSRLLRGLGDLLKSNRQDARLARILPLVALPTAVVYAALESSQIPAKR